MSNISTSGLQHIELKNPINDDEEHGLLSSTSKPQFFSEKTPVNFRLRLFLFCLIETVFIILAAVCLIKPLPLNIALKFDDARVKGGFTVVFIVWHSLAVFVGGCIPTDAFSREWSVQLANIVPGTTDRVSTVTSGMLDRILHIFTTHASGTFKLAFLASLTLVALTQLAPGTISAATTNVHVPTTVNVARQVSQITNGNVGQILTSSSRADLIVRLEKIELTPFGFKLPPHTLMSLPPHLDESNRTLEYNTDIVKFHHDCRWEAPSIFGLSISAAGEIWSTTLINGSQANAGSSISPLSLTNFTAMMNTSTTAYLFIGGNSTHTNNHTMSQTPFAINLDNLPTTFVAQGVGVAAGPDIRLVGPLSSVLVCDLHPSISGGRVRLAADGTVDIISSGQPPDGSFPSSAVNLVFSNAFQVTLQGLEALELQNLVNNVAADMFMANSSVDWNQVRNIAPLDILSINNHMDDFMSSAAKAFIDGYRKVGTNANPTFDVMSVPGIGEEQRLALTTSKELFTTTVVLDVIAVVLLYTLLRLSVTRKRYPFDLRNIVRIAEDPEIRVSLFKHTTGKGKDLA